MEPTVSPCMRCASQMRQMFSSLNTGAAAQQEHASMLNGSLQMSSRMEISRVEFSWSKMMRTSAEIRKCHAMQISVLGNSNIQASRSALRQALKAATKSIGLLLCKGCSESRVAQLHRGDCLPVPISNNVMYHGEARKQALGQT